MELTREQAITEHRKMWNWIADEIEKQKICKVIATLKRDYFILKYNEPFDAYCFLCLYVKQRHVGCNECPIKWEGGCCINKKETGIYDRCIKSGTWQEQSALARQIANLPERNN